MTEQQKDSDRHTMRLGRGNKAIQSFEWTLDISDEGSLRAKSVFFFNIVKKTFDPPPPLV